MRARLPGRALPAQRERELVVGLGIVGRKPNGLAETQYRKLIQSNPDALQWGWQTLRRNPRAYARGRVRHSDHATITLPDWHRVVLNTETETETMRNVAFVD